jgi:hypothetical protein
LRLSELIHGGLSFGLVFLSLSVLPLEAREIDPDAKLCDEINSLRPGEVLNLRRGDYHGPCKVLRGGTAGAPIVIQARQHNEKPRIIYDGENNNVFEILADFVTLRGLKIGPTKRNVGAVRILARAGITIEDCEFFQLGGIAVAATRTSVNGLYVRRNVVANITATAMYFGCHDGDGCQISNLFVERNFIHGVDTADPEIGYGIQFKLNTTGIISDNVVVDTKGPGVMVYGSLDSNRSSVVERNFVSGSRKSSGIVIGGGPARVRNNIVQHNRLAGIALQDYGNRGLLRQIVIVNNTTVANFNGEIVVPPETKLSQTLLALNAAMPTEYSEAFPRPRTGLEGRQNIDCRTQVCFVDPSALNFSPLPKSPVSRVRTSFDRRFPTDDYFGRRRKKQLTAGAVAFPGPSIRLGIKSNASLTADSSSRY